MTLRRMIAATSPVPPVNRHFYEQVEGGLRKRFTKDPIHLSFQVCPDGRA